MARGNFQSFAQEGTQCRVRLSFDRPRAQLDLDRRAVFAGDLVGLSRLELCETAVSPFTTVAAVYDRRIEQTPRSGFGYLGSGGVGSHGPAASFNSVYNSPSISPLTCGRPAYFFGSRKTSFCSSSPIVVFRRMISLKGLMLEHVHHWARQISFVPEAVAISQPLELVLENDVGRLADHSARHMFFGKCAEPDVDIVRRSIRRSELCSDYRIGISSVRKLCKVATHNPFSPDCNAADRDRGRAGY